jgi:predicted lipid-binding transport protein (Tim44 family)
MPFLYEELSQNPTQGLRSKVRNTRLFHADVSEAWRETGGDFAIVAMRYESVDVMRNGATWAVVEGSDMPTTTTELWTSIRTPGAAWKLSAIQKV